MVFIVNEYEWVTAKNITKIAGLVERLGFTAVFNHLEVSVGKDIVELTGKEIRDGDVQPLQRNGIYICCQLPEGFKLKGNELVIRGFQHRLSNPIGKYLVPIGVNDPEEGEFYPIPVKMRKDIVFYCGSQELGWYNKATNILWVSDVTHYPDKDPITFVRMLDAVNALKTTGTVADALNITLGSDPEFELINPATGQLFNAGQYFNSHNVGHDGHAEIGEVRPKPGASPLSLTRNLRKVLNELAHHQRFPEGAVVGAGGGTRWYCGGHVHIGGFSELPPVARMAVWRLCGRWVIESQSDLRKGREELWREDGHDLYRPQPHGCEFRGMPSWIVNEEMAKAVLCTFTTVLKGALFGEITEADLKNPDPTATLPELALYKIYKKHIDRFIQMFVGVKTQLEGRDVLQEWNLKQHVFRPSVQIISSMPWIQKFFQPVMLKKFDGTIKVNIEFNGNSIQVAGVKRKASSLMRQFAQSHFVEFERLARGIGAPGNMVVYLPVAWARLTSTTRAKFLNEFKDIVKFAIIEHRDDLLKGKEKA